MRTAENPAWRERVLKGGPVEGPSEIDIVFEGRTYVVFIEAKLGSDISLRTTYDPERNQIARNVDCVLEACGTRRPLFWMFVRDREPTRAYMQLMDHYRSVADLSSSLPHRVASRLGEIASSLAVFEWADLMALLTDTKRLGIEVAVQQELQRRLDSL